MTPKKLQHLANNAASRLLERDQYQTNIDSHTHVLEALPQGEVPAEIIQYMATPADQLPYDFSDTTRMLVADYQHRNAIRALLAAEKIQQNIVKWALHGVKMQIPAADYDKAVDEALTRFEAQLAK